MIRLNYVEQVIEDLRNIDVKYVIPIGALQITSNALAVILDLVVEKSQLNQQIDEQQAEIKILQERITALTPDYIMFASKITDVINYIRKELSQEILKGILKEIEEALNNNYKVRSERMNITECYAEDTFISYCNGKIDCLRGLENFIQELLGERND